MLRTKNGSLSCVIVRKKYLRKHVDKPPKLDFLKLTKLRLDFLYKIINVILTNFTVFCCNNCNNYFLQ